MYTRNEYLVELYKSYWKNEVVDFDKISQEEKRSGTGDCYEFENCCSKAELI